MPKFQPGQPKIAGRQVGTPNKATKTLKEMILRALDGAGGEAYLIRQAEQNPGPFLTLVGKVLPLQVTGEGGGALVIRWERDKPEEPQSSTAVAPGEN